MSGFETYNTTLMKNTGRNSHPIFVGTPTTGIVRVEWALARFGQTIPCNWGYKTGFVPIPNCAPLNYLVADAQNLIARKFLDEKCEWLLLVESDNVLPPDCFIRLNDYMRNEDTPVVSGLYFTKSVPAEPLVYRGRGNSYFGDWKLGDLVWCDGVPTGCLLIHRSIIQAVWDESEEYLVGPDKTRKVFSWPQGVWHDPEAGWQVANGTSDLEFCARVMVEDIFKKAGWSKFQEKEYPFLVDTNILVGHIDNDGVVYPTPPDKAKWEKVKEK